MAGPNLLQAIISISNCLEGRNRQINLLSNMYLLLTIFRPINRTFLDTNEYINSLRVADIHLYLILCN